MSLLKENNISFTIVEYLKVPLTKQEILLLSQKLGKRPKDFIRRTELDFKENDIKLLIDDDQRLALAERVGAERHESKDSERAEEILHRRVLCCSEKRMPTLAIEIPRDWTIEPVAVGGVERKDPGTTSLSHTSETVDPTVTWLLNPSNEIRPVAFIAIAVCAKPTAKAVGSAAVARRIRGVPPTR